MEHRLVANFIAGMDGSGGQAKWNGLSSARSDFSDHLLYGGIAMLSIQVESTLPLPTIYTVPTPSSVDNERPLFLCSGGETDPILEEVAAKWDEDFLELSQDIEVQFGDKTLTFRVNVDLTQLDGKIRKRLEGRGSAYCLFCLRTLEESMNIDLIKVGFVMDVDNETLVQCYDALKEEIGTNPDGSKEYYIDPKLDKELKMGLTRSPMLHHFDVINNLPALHAKLRFTSFVEIIILRVGTGWITYFKVKDPVMAKKWKDAEARLRSESKEFLKWQMYGCQTDTGNVARAFFACENRDAACSLFHSENEDLVTTFRQLVQRFSIILRIYGSKEAINVPRFEEYLKETYILLVTKFHFIHLTPTVHALLAHGAEMVRRNDGHGLGTKCEEGLEGSMKVLRRTREVGSRKNSIPNSHQDIVNKMLVKSFPRCRDFRLAPPCKVCKQWGHTIRSCPKRGKNEKELTPDDEIIRELIYTDPLEDGVPTSCDF